jgi:signal transduction histidine kinase
MTFLSKKYRFILHTLIVLSLLSCKESKKEVVQFSAEEKEWLSHHQKGLTFSVEDNYPPLSFRNKKGKLVGLNIDLVKLLESKIGIPITLKGTSWDQALQLAMNHEVDGIINAAALKERKNKLVFAKDFMQDPKAMVKRKHDPEIDFNSSGSKIRVAVMKNSTHLEYIKNKYHNVEIHEITTLKDGINLLVLNEVDVLYDNLAPLYQLISSLNLNYVKIISVDYNYDNQSGGIGLRNNDPLLLSVINKAIASLTDGELNKVKERWINITPQPDYTLFYLVSGLLVLATGLTVFWNRSLKSLVEKKTSELSVELDERKKVEERLIEYKKQLEFTVDERTSDLVEVNNELLKTNDVLVDQKNELNETLIHLKKTQKQLIHSEKMASVGMLSSGVAHEINNPLNFIKGGISGLSNTLKTYSIDQKELSPFIDIIEEGVSRAAKIVKSLSHFSRTKKEVTPCDINRIIDNCLVMLHNQLKHKIEITKVYSKSTKVVLGNEGQLHQAFLNIISNAEQAIATKGKISISTEYRNNMMCIKIADNGCGIKEQDEVKIGNPFFTTKDPNMGTGLGLFITFKIIDDHKGKIGYESKKGEGTEVEICLPYES